MSVRLMTSALFSLALAAVTFSAQAIPISACLDFEFSTTGYGKCYIGNTALNTWQFHENTAIALGQGFQLVSIHSPEENTFVRNFADSTIGQRSFWIGLNDVAEEGTFVWSDGTPVDFLNWNPGEPNNLGNEDGVVATDARVFPLAGWNDYRADFQSNPGQYAVYSALLDTVISVPSSSSFSALFVGFMGCLGLMSTKLRKANGDTPRVL